MSGTGHGRPESRCQPFSSNQVGSEAAGRRREKTGGDRRLPIKETLQRAGLISHRSDPSGVAVKVVKAVVGFLEQAVSSSISKKGASAFSADGQRSSKPPTINTLVNPV